VLIGDQAWAGHIKFHEDSAPEHVGGLISDPGELFTLQGTQSPTTINALKALLATYQRRAKSDPDHYPVIRLKVGTYENRKFGTLPKPAFTIVGKAPKASSAKPDTSISADMNDTIPF
jgi:hypothetical protein